MVSHVAQMAQFQAEMEADAARMWAERPLAVGEYVAWAPQSVEPLIAAFSAAVAQVVEVGAQGVKLQRWAVYFDSAGHEWLAADDPEASWWAPLAECSAITSYDNVCAHLAWLDLAEQQYATHPGTLAALQTYLGEHLDAILTMQDMLARGLPFGRAPEWDVQESAAQTGQTQSQEGGAA